VVRKTPLPLLRDLAPDLLVLRCGQCRELVLLHELCQDAVSVACCPKRWEIEGLNAACMTLPRAPMLPLVSLRGTLTDV